MCDWASSAPHPDDGVGPSPLTLDCPILLDGCPNGVLLSGADLQKLARDAGSHRLQDLLASYPSVTRLATVTRPGESVVNGWNDWRRNRFKRPVPARPSFCWTM